MPIGASKVGALGGLVPGGSETFNASGTFSVPPGVKVVSVTGVGSPGTPGTSGNAGNAGNPGLGGRGGGAGALTWNGPFPLFDLGETAGGPGGAIYTNVPICNNVSRGGRGGSTNPSQFSWGGCNAEPVNAPNTQGPINYFAGTPSGEAGTPGPGGSAGQAGQAGQTGCCGQASSVFGQQFPGGLGGNAGNAGQGGQGGQGGNGGNGGNGNAYGCVPNANPLIGNGGTGGNGGGSGGQGGWKGPNPPGCATVYGARGGGGAGVNTDGPGGNQGFFGRNQPGLYPTFANTVGVGGATSGACLPRNPTPNPTAAAQFNNCQTGGGGGDGGFLKGVQRGGHVFDGTPRSGNIVNPSANSTSCYQMQIGYRNVPVINAVPRSNNAWRSGAGGGGGANKPGNPIAISGGGGGGGGGRGNAGNPGTCGGAGGCGFAGNPTTNNCVPVIPGSCYPVTVASPGGSIVISWNPQ